MRRKWNKCLIDEDPGFVEVSGDGTVRRGLRFLYGDEDIEMIRQGYKCIDCGEVMRSQDGAFPPACFLCGFPMREKQAGMFGEMFAGWRATGSSIDWDAEEERLVKQRWERERAEGIRTKGVWLPS